MKYSHRQEETLRCARLEQIPPFVRVLRRKRQRHYLEFEHVRRERLPVAEFLLETGDQFVLSDHHEAQRPPVHIEYEHRLDHVERLLQAHSARNDGQHDVRLLLAGRQWMSAAAAAISATVFRQSGWMR